jgi:hypothetical protein
MTLVVAALGRESIWIRANRRILTDDATKILRLERGSDAALLGYSGLGKTPRGTQPSEWMNAVLRGKNEPIERSLEIIGGAIGRQIPKYMLKVPGAGDAAHVVLAPAFVAERPLLYTLRLDLDGKNSRHRVSAVRHETVDGPRRYVRIGLAGSGTPKLLNDRAKLLSLLRLISKHEKKRIPAFTVAREFARLNLEVSRKEPSVGPDCIVAWHYRRNGPIKLSPAFQAFSGLTRATGAVALPINSNGME